MKLLYCDSVLVEPAIEMKRPVIAGWVSGDLKNRQKNELESGGFGSGELLLEWRDTPAGKEYLKVMLAEHSHKDVHFDGCGCTKPDGDDGGEEQTEQEVVESVLKALENVGKQIYDVVGRFDDNEQLQSIMKK